LYFLALDHHTYTLVHTMSHSKYKVRIKNKETSTSWTFVVQRESKSSRAAHRDEQEEEDSEGFHATTVSQEIYQLLEDTDMVSSIKEISESLLDSEPSDITWNEKILKISFEDCDQDGAICEVIEALREHLEDTLDSCVTTDPHED
jgi:hypothetical protein